MNILLTLNKNYLPYMISLIRSINDFNHFDIDFYIFSNDIELTDINKYQEYLSFNNHFHIIKISKNTLIDAPISSRYPYEMYYRIFAAKYLPSSIDKILYLDPDIIVKGNLTSLYNLDLGDNYFAGACNIRKLLKRINQIKNGADKECEYINTGVLLINIALLRKEQNVNDVYKYIEKYKYLFTLPDQDIISTLYGKKIILIDKLIYNLSDRSIKFYNASLVNINNKIDLSWIEKNTIIIHYFGKNKPWYKNYRGILKCYYDKYKVERK